MQYIQTMVLTNSLLYWPCISISEHLKTQTIVLNKYGAQAVEYEWIEITLVDHSLSHLLCNSFILL